MWIRQRSKVKPKMLSNFESKFASGLRTEASQTISSIHHVIACIVSLYLFLWQLFLVVALTSIAPTVEESSTIFVLARFDSDVCA